MAGGMYDEQGRLDDLEAFFDVHYPIGDLSWDPPMPVGVPGLGYQVAPADLRDTDRVFATQNAVRINPSHYSPRFLVDLDLHDRERNRRFLEKYNLDARLGYIVNSTGTLYWVDRHNWMRTAYPELPPMED